MAEELTVTFVLGTRPEIIKFAPVIKGCQDRGISFSLVHTGQHYDDELDSVFFEQLDLRTPDSNLGVGSDSHGQQTGRMLCELEATLLEDSPDIVLVQGDTNSVLAGALAGSKLPIDVGHVEAGLRSYQPDMPEEINRRVADHVSDLLFAPTDHAADVLEGEDISPEQIYTTGNTIVDAVYESRTIADEKSTVLADFSLREREFAVLTIHRAENVDTAERFESILEGVAAFASETGLGVVYPIHPRAKAALKEYDLVVPDEIRVVEPLDYIDFLHLQANAGVIFTDSGGVQEEACILDVPCVTVRDETERPETVDVGANVVVGTDENEIHQQGIKAYRADRTWTNPFGDGQSADRILDVIEERYDL